MPTIEVLPNKPGSTQRTGNSSWFYSTAGPSQSVSAMPTAADLRVRKAKKEGQLVEVTDKKDLAAQKRITELEKVNWRDVLIKLPDKKDARKPKSANVRKILQSNKTFKNYLDEYNALRTAPQASSSLSSNPPVSTSGTDIDDPNIPLSYGDAVAAPPSNLATAKRHFCEICGYWGTIKCMKCGTRACSGQCLTTHQESRCAKAFL